MHNKEMESNINKAAEDVMLSRLLSAAKEFYNNPENVKAFEAWKEKKEAKA